MVLECRNCLVYQSHTRAVRIRQIEFKSQCFFEAFQRNAPNVFTFCADIAAHLRYFDIPKKPIKQVVKFLFRMVLLDLWLVLKIANSDARFILQSKGSCNHDTCKLLRKEGIFNASLSYPPRKWRLGRCM